MKLIVVSAPSGAGKTTLCQHLLSEVPGLILSISSTTRPPRRGEQNGKDYFFISKEEFKKQIEQGKFIEWAEVHGNYYGTSTEVIDEALRSKKSVLLDIDVQGAKTIKKKYGSKALLIFLAPPSLEILEKRLRDRATETEASIVKRMQSATWEMSQQYVFDHVIVNDDLNRAKTELSGIVKTFLGNQ
jgi:guanylate kinase